MAEHVKEYYGKILKKSEDLKTNACCTNVRLPREIVQILRMVNDEVISKYYGCGLTIPSDFSNLKGLKILDLGSGSGRDCFLLSKLVGEEGRVVGVDMTEEQIAVARKHIPYHTEKFGYSKPNVEFLQGYIEQLDKLELGEGVFDIVVSNCVVNLSPDKKSVLAGVYKLLKPGGELYFSDVYADRRVPKHLRENEVLWGECLSGAMYWNDFIGLAKEVGFGDPRLVEDSRITIANKELEALIGHINFFSATYRLFKLDGLESACEDYGQAVIYNGGIASLPNAYVLDNHHTIETGRVFPVCGNTLKMLTCTRLAPFFQVIGDGRVHYGLFVGGARVPFVSAVAVDTSNGSKGGGGGGGCC